MPADMDNHNSLAVRRRGATKHSVEDQALDQIAKEKLVGFANDRTSNDGSDEDVPQSVSPEVSLPAQPRQSKKKKKSKKNKKSKIDESDLVIDEDDNVKVSSHVIPDIFYEELSETDKSKEDNNTSPDISSSDLSESAISEKKIDNDMLKENVDDAKDAGDDFWASLEDITDGSKRDKISDSGSVVDTLGENSSPDKKADYLKDYKTDERAEENNVKIENEASPEPQNDPIKSDSFNDSATDEVDDFWANHDEDQAFIARKTSLRSSNSHCSSESPEKSQTPERLHSADDGETHSNSIIDDSETGEKFESIGANEDVQCKSRTLSSGPDNPGNESLNEVEPDIHNQKRNEAIDREHNIWDQDDLPPVYQIKRSKSSNEIEDTSIVENVPQVVEPLSKAESDDVENIWTEEDLPPVYQIKMSKSPSELEETTIDPLDKENAQNSDPTPNVASCKMENISHEENLPLVSQIKRSESPSEETKVEPIDKEELSESNVGDVENIWGDEDLPPVYQIKRSKSPSEVKEALNETLDKETEAVTNDKFRKSEKLKSTSPRCSESDPTDDIIAESDNSSDTSTDATQKKTDVDEESSDSENDASDADEDDVSGDSEGDHEDKHNNGSTVKVRQVDPEKAWAPPTPPPLPRSPPPYARSPPPSARQSLSSQASIDSRNRTRLLSETSTDGDVRDDGIMDFLGKENDRAEARLAARRQARVEAREIRMREIERVQKEQEENSDKILDLHCTTPPHINNTRQSSMSPRERPTPTPNNSYHSSRRSSEDSMEDGLNLRDIRHELKEVEDKFRKAMIANAQLDNEKAAHAYQVELLKDRFEDLEESHALLNREYREKCRELESLKRVAMKLKEDLTLCKMCLDERDRLIADYGLIIVGGDIDEKGEATPRALVSREAAQLLEAAGEGSLDVRLRALANEKNELADEVRHLKLELEEERNRRRAEERASNGSVPADIQQTLNDYRFRLQKTEQDTSTLQATVALLESQVVRYKSAAEESEKAEEDLKQEKRKLLRENRESIARIEELETSNSHLQRRMDKLKNAKSTLLKEL